MMSSTTKRKLCEIEKTADIPVGQSRKSWKSVAAAVQYHEAGQYGKALPLLFKYEDAEARAMFLLAYMYSKGLGVIENMRTAASYLLKLVDFGGIRKEEEDLLAMAHYYLGDLYYRGVVLARDDKKAVNHWRKGAILDKDRETGEPHYGTMRCQTSLGMYYSNPKFKTGKKAFHWHKKAAESGSVVSEGALGVMYMLGVGTEEDMQLAYNHLTSAAVMDNVYAKGHLAEFYYKRQMYHRTVCLGRELSEIEDYEMLADLDDCNVDHIKQGVAVGCFYLAMCLQGGYGVEKDLSKAKKLIKKALIISTDITYDLHIKALLSSV